MPLPTGRLIDVRALGEPLFIAEENRTDLYGFVQDEWRFAPDWTLTAGVRVDRYSDFGTTVNPRLALVGNLSPSLTAKLLYGRAFRAPISFGIIIAFVENRDFSSLNRVVAGIPNRCLPWEHGVPELQPSGEAGAAGERLYPTP